MSFPMVISADNNLCFPKLLLDSLILEAGYIYLFNSSPLTSPEHSPPSSAASSPLSTPPALPPPTLPSPLTANDDVPSMSMPPAHPALSNPVGNSTHAKHQGHANRRKKRELERAAAGLARWQRVDSYRPRPASAKKHIKSANKYQTRFNSNTIPIASSGYVAVPGDKSSTAYPLDLLVGSQSHFKMRNVTWNGE